MGHLARTPDFAGSVRTISVGEALRRVERVVDGYQEPGGYVHVLLETRNGIVHAGYGVRQESEVVLGDVARYLAPLLVKAGMTDSAYWGDARDLVAQHADRRLNDIEAAYGRAIQAARDRYALRVKEMSKIAISAFVAAVEPKGPSADFTTFPVRCPACEHTGTLSGDPEPSWEPDWDYGDGQAYVAGKYVDTINLHASRFECPVCNLALADADLELAAIDALTFRDSAFDAGLAYVHFRRIEADELLADWDR